MKNEQDPLPSVAAKLDNVTVPHTRFIEIEDRLIQFIRFQTDAKIILVVGPTGVGKSKLIKRLRVKIAKEAERMVAGDTSRVPFVHFEVPCLQIGNFSWPGFYELYLEQLEMPMLPLKQPGGRNTTAMRSVCVDNVVVKALQHRRPLVTLLDEANHFAQVASAKRLDHQMNKLKSLVNRSDVLHICFGTYELARMMSVTGQLARRTEVIHFPRYHADDARDMAMFGGVVRGFAKAIPTEPGLDLNKYVPFLHERSIGCAGTLKAWLNKALGYAHGANRTFVTLDDLNKSALPLIKLRPMLKEATEGESLFREEARDRDLFLQELGHTSAAPVSDGATHKPQRGGPVGERAPHRDPTGTAFDPEYDQKAS